MQKIQLAILLSVLALEAAAPSLMFLSRPYTLGSFNQKTAATWEYVTGGETVDNWTTLVTLIDRADAHTMPEVDRLAEGVMNTYKSHGGKILLARTMQEKSGKAFNYMVAAFEEPAKHRFELNFVKVVLGPKNAVIVVYGARVSDPKDYAAKGKEFLDKNSAEIGKALETFPLPDLAALPRKEF